jgi:hypothetical protein
LGDKQYTYDLSRWGLMDNVQNENCITFIIIAFRTFIYFSNFLLLNLAGTILSNEWDDKEKQNELCQTIEKVKRPRLSR